MRVRHEEPFGVPELAADDGFTTVFDDHCQEEITWSGEDDVQQVATLPVVTFARTGRGVTRGTSQKEVR